MLTHTDGDHLGGLPSILKEFRPHTLFESGVVGSSRLYEEYRDVGAKLTLSPQILKRGDNIEGISGVTLEILHPPRPFLRGTGRDENNNGLVLKMRYGKTAFLFSADLEKDGVQSLLDSNQPLSAQILKVPHHGGRVGNLRQFLLAVRPEIAVISVGSAKRYSHPAPSTLEELVRFGLEVHQTVQEGAVVVESDGSRFFVKKSVRRGD